MTELDELKQRLEIEELRGRLSAAEKQISILTDTLATLTEIQTSDRLGSYINSQVRLLKAAGIPQFRVRRRKDSSAAPAAERRTGGDSQGGA